jgi:hypothetical protein
LKFEKRNRIPVYRARARRWAEMIIMLISYPASFAKDLLNYLALETQTEKRNQEENCLLAQEGFLYL